MDKTAIVTWRQGTGGGRRAMITTDKLARARARQRERLVKQSPDWLTIFGEMCRPLNSRPAAKYPDRKKEVR